MLLPEGGGVPPDVVFGGVAGGAAGRGFRPESDAAVRSALARWSASEPHALLRIFAALGRAWALHTRATAERLAGERLQFELSTAPEGCQVEAQFEAASGQPHSVMMSLGLDSESQPAEGARLVAAYSLHDENSPPTLGLILGSEDTATLVAGGCMASGLSPWQAAGAVLPPWRAGACLAEFLPAAEEELAARLGAARAALAAAEAEAEEARAAAAAKAAAESAAAAAAAQRASAWAARRAAAEATAVAAAEGGDGVDASSAMGGLLGRSRALFGGEATTAGKADDVFTDEECNTCDESQSLATPVAATETIAAPAAAATLSSDGGVASQQALVDDMLAELGEAAAELEVGRGHTLVDPLAGGTALRRLDARGEAMPAGGVGDPLLRSDSARSDDLVHTAAAVAAEAISPEDRGAAAAQFGKLLGERASQRKR